jgi:hypothetical protein
MANFRIRQFLLRTVKKDEHQKMDERERERDLTIILVASWTRKVRINSTDQMN